MPFRKLTLFAVLGLVLVGWPVESAAAAAQTVSRTAASAQCAEGEVLINDVCQPQRAPQPTGSEGDGGDGSTKAILGILALAAAGAVVVCAAGACSKAQSASRLTGKGPQLVRDLPGNLFQNYGFIQDGWRMAIDYAATSDVEFTVTIDKEVVFRETLPAGRQQRVLTFGTGARKSQVALFSARAADDSRIFVAGLGAGPGAVLARGPERGRSLLARDDGASFLLVRDGPGRPASPVAVNTLRFGPPQLRASTQQAAFSYRKETDLEQLKSDILRYSDHWVKKDGQDVLVFDAERVWRDPSKQLTSAGPVSGVWNGRDTNKRVSVGEHRLQVRAWRVKGDRGWVIAISPEAVVVAN